VAHTQPDNTEEGVQPQEWTQAFAAKLEDAFGEAFADSVVLEASALRKPLSGRAAVQTAMANGQPHLRVGGVHPSGAERTTNLHRMGSEGMRWHRDRRNNDPPQERRRSNRAHRHHHRPLDALLAFSAEMGRRTERLVEPGHFYTESDTNGEATRQ
jgi:hypothetical protein